MDDGRRRLSKLERFNCGHEPLVAVEWIRNERSRREHQVFAEVQIQCDEIWDGGHEAQTLSNEEVLSGNTTRGSSLARREVAARNVHE